MKKLISFLSGELGRILLALAFFISALAVDYVDRIYSFSFRAFILYVIALLIAGIPVFMDAIRGILRRDLLDEKFLMSIASVGAMIVGECSEGVAVMLFFLVGEYFEHKAVAKSRKSIRALMDIRPDEATVLGEGCEKTVSADEVALGSVIVIRTGERVPIDSVIISGTADVDTSALSGESIPRQVGVGDKLSSGFVIINGVLRAETVCMADESAASRILDLVENANERKSKTESFITKFSHYYTPVVVLAALIIAVFPPLFKLVLWQESIYRALIFLVVSCPCALVISVPMAFFGGIGGAASKGILYKGGNVFSSLAKADCFVFDKTGTLTNGNFIVAKVNGHKIGENELLYYAASAEYGSNHPIAKCIKNASPKCSVPSEVSEVAGKGISAVVDGDAVLVGSRAWLLEADVKISDNAVESEAIYVARNGVYVGSIVIRDKIKDEASEAIKELRKSGVSELVMLSGDKREIAEEVGRQIGISTVCSELLPENKYDNLKKLKNSHKNVVYVGDGINDAPAIAEADVGVAMGEIGSDAAIEACDVVIMSDNLGKLPLAIKIARKTVRIAKQNIIFALGIKALILVMGAFGFANMWLAVFADVGVAALAILNSMRTLA
ncbi:MAG: cadmium-translocating P-type ATPase [Ruminococcaceae bacterium]|nr:cadmium-translocating P-type ATPase [Oscillospiraceae bacterium]